MPCSKCGTNGHNIRTCTWKPKKKNDKKKKEPIDCCVCYEELGSGLVTTSCGHNYCAPCFAKWMRKSGSCAYCREEVCEAPNRIDTISDDVQEHFITELLEGPDLVSEIRQEIRKQMVKGVYDRYGRNAEGVDGIVDTVDYIIHWLDTSYITSIVGYDIMAIISEHNQT